MNVQLPPLWSSCSCLLIFMIFARSSADSSCCCFGFDSCQEIVDSDSRMSSLVAGNYYSVEDHSSVSTAEYYLLSNQLFPTSVDWSHFDISWLPSNASSLHLSAASPFAAVSGAVWHWAHPSASSPQHGSTPAAAVDPAQDSFRVSWSFYCLSVSGYEAPALCLKAVSSTLWDCHFHFAIWIAYSNNVPYLVCCLTSVFPSPSADFRFTFGEPERPCSDFSVLIGVGFELSCYCGPFQAPASDFLLQILVSMFFPGMLWLHLRPPCWKSGPADSGSSGSAVRICSPCSASVPAISTRSAHCLYLRFARAYLSPSAQHPSSASNYWLGYNRYSARPGLAFSPSRWSTALNLRILCSHFAEVYWPAFLADYQKKHNHSGFLEFWPCLVWEEEVDLQLLAQSRYHLGSTYWAQRPPARADSCTRWDLEAEPVLPRCLMVPCYLNYWYQDLTFWMFDLYIIF